MPIIKCKMCGGDIQLAEDKTFGTYEYCGSVMTLPRVSDEQRAAAFNRGNHFRRAGEFDKALGVYEHIVADDDTDAEAHWCCALCRFGIEYVEDPATYEWLPTCHRASFDSFLEDVDYLAALEHSDGITRRQYQKDAAKIAEVQRGILAASQNTEPYDVFISYKELDGNGERTRDSILAQEIYYRLTEKGWRVFFSRISLEDVPGTQYEPYIFAALNSAKVMVVVGTSAENLNAVWVKNEWSRFLAMMRKDRSKLLIPCYRDMDPYDLPEQLSVLMSYDMSRIGFIQDLIRGVDKVLSAEKKEETVRETVKETVVVQQSGDSAARITAAMDRGFMALEDGEWNKAVSFFDQALSLDAKNARAYYGMALAKNQCKDAAAYIEKLCNQTLGAETIELPPDTKHIRDAAQKYAVPGYLSDAEITALYRYKPGYSSTEKAQKQLSVKARSNFENDHNLTRARQFAAGETKTELDELQMELFERLDNSIEQAARSARAAKEQAEKDYLRFLESKDKLAEEKKRDAEAKREQDYQFALQRFKQANSIEAYKNTKPLFLKLAPYRDSAEMAKRCDVEAARLEREKAEETERKRKAEAEEAERQRAAREKEEKARKSKRKRLIIAVVFAVVFAIAGYFTYTNVVVPANSYKIAEVLFESGQYEEAILAFTALGDYKDSQAKVDEVKEALRARDYNAAKTLFESGQYEEAVLAFTALGDYKDSQAKADKVKEAIHARDYSAAEALFESGQYEEAFTAFAMLGNYKDSAVKAEKIKPQYYKSLLMNAKVGSKVYLGAYEQDNDASNGEEDIEWRVLAKEGGRILVTSQYALDCQPYNTKYEEITWYSCTLRKWLNETFLNAAFSAEEQAMIPTVTVSADKNPDYNSAITGSNTQDRVFLLSIPEVKQYLRSDEARKCIPTEYAISQGAWISNDNSVGGKATIWWLRTPGFNPNFGASCSPHAADVNHRGAIYSDGIMVSKNEAVRPVIWIELPQ